jgi:HK97 family phage portal protein
MRLWERLKAAFQRDNPVWEEIITEVLASDTGGGVKPVDQDYAAFLQALNVFPLVSAVVGKISSTAADVPLIVCSLDGTPLDSHPLKDLLEAPNPTPSGGRTAFFQSMYQQILLTGTLNVAVGNTMEDPQELWVLESSRTFPVPSKFSAFPYVAYEYDGGRGAIKRIPQERVMRVIKPHPYDPLAGLSPLKELGPTLDLMWEQRTANKALFANGMKLGGILNLKGKGKISEEQKAVIRRAGEARHAGSKKAGRLMVIHSEDAEFMKDTSTPREMEGVAMYDVLRLEVFNVYQAPPGLFDSKDVNRSNMKEQRALLYTDAVKPLVSLVLDAFNASEMTAGVRIKADWSAIPALQPNQLELANRDKIYIAAGAVTVNEIRELRDLGEPLEGGDEPKGGGETPPALAPFTGEDAPNGNGAGPEPEPEEEEVNA